MKFGARQATSDMVARTALCESLLGLADMLLDGYRTHLESIRGGEKHDLLVHQYELQRRNIIKPLCKFALHLHTYILGFVLYTVFTLEAR